MTMGKVLDPTASRDDDIASPGPDAGAIAGRRIGIRLDQIWRAWDWIAQDWAARLEAAGAEVSFWRSCGRSGEEGARMERELAAWLGTIDMAIIGLANCGSCTGWTVRDAMRSLAPIAAFPRLPSPPKISAPSPMRSPRAAGARGCACMCCPIP